LLDVDRLDAVLHGVEVPRLWGLDFLREVVVYVFHHDPVRHSEEAQNELKHVALIVRHNLPVKRVLVPRDFLGRPVGRAVLLGKQVELWKPDGEQREPRLQEGLGLSHFATDEQRLRPAL